MSPLVVFSMCALLPVVFSADVERLQKSIEVFEQNTADNKEAVLLLKNQIDSLGGVFKTIITNLTQAKGGVSKENSDVLKTLTTAVHTLKALRTTEARERDEVNLHKAILKKVNLAQKWLTQDIGVLEQRKSDGDDAECQRIEANHKARQSSRSLVDDDEEMLLKEELKQAEIAAFDTAQEKKLLEKKLKNEQEQWKSEVKSAFELISQYKHKLADLNAKLQAKNGDIKEVEKSIADLLEEKAALLVAIREAGIKFKKDVKVLKSFQPSAECYLAVRNSVAKAH